MAVRTFSHLSFCHLATRQRCAVWSSFCLSHRSHTVPLQFQVTLGNTAAGGQQPRPYKVLLTKVAEINPECVCSCVHISSRELHA